MKWFQMDSDMPSDPKMRSIIKLFGNAGIGALIRLWCFIADHGTRPGWSIDSHGKPFEKATLVEATGLTEREYLDLVDELVQNGHFSKRPFVKRGLIVIPAMSKRASNYEKYQRRRRDNDASSKRRQQYSTVQDSTSTARTRASSRRSPVSSATTTPPTGSHCAHVPRCPTFKACLARVVAEARHAPKRKG